MTVTELKFGDLTPSVPVTPAEVPGQGPSLVSRGVSVRETGVVAGLLREETLFG